MADRSSRSRSLLKRLGLAADLGDQGPETLAPKPELDAVGLDLDALYEELDYARLLRGEQFLPYRVESLEGVDDVAFGEDVRLEIICATGLGLQTSLDIVDFIPSSTKYVDERAASSSSVDPGAFVG